MSGETPAATGDKFYEDAKEYWGGIPPTVDGMLGGFSHISSTDIGGSQKFLRPYIRGQNGRTGTTYALDCGAGIGRISKLLLTNIFDKVDLCELNQSFLDMAPNYLGPEKAAKIGRYICTGLQDFQPEEGKYDVIWCQWVLGHLTEEDFVVFLKRCQKGLKENGIIILKENVASTGTADFDEQDSSYTRPKQTWVKLMNQSGLKILQEEKQKNFPKDIYDVWMFALQ